MLFRAGKITGETEQLEKKSPPMIVVRLVSKLTSQQLNRFLQLTFVKKFLDAHGCTFLG
jgi:hypothetical protein